MAADHISSVPKSDCIGVGNRHYTVAVTTSNWDVIRRKRRRRI